jgi:hypothetical protein
MDILFALLWALVYCAIIGVVGWVIIWIITTYFPQIAPPAVVVVRVICGIAMLIILVQVLSGVVGGGHVRLPHLNDR